MDIQCVHILYMYSRCRGHARFENVPSITLLIEGEGEGRGGGGRECMRRSCERQLDVCVSRPT